MKARVITGVIAAALLIALVLAGPMQLIMAAVIGASLIAYFEFDRLFFTQVSYYRRARIFVLITITVISLADDPARAWKVPWISLVLLCLVHFFRVYRGKDIREVVSQLALEFMGYCYVICLLGFVVPIAHMGRELLLLLFLIVFLGDTAAYFVGIRFGKFRFVPMVSPKKSLEGSLAALLSSLLVCGCWLIIFREAYFDRMGMMLMIATPLFSILAQIGDLFESMLKRSQSQKDSGTLLPGHGGILDRIDGLALASPVFYLCLEWWLAA